MHIPPYPPPFAAPIPSTPLTDAIMGKLTSPIAKTHRAELNKVGINCKKANTRRPKEAPGKHVVGKKLHSPNSSPSEIPISVLSKGSPTGYYINRNNLPWLSIVFRPPVGMELDETDLQVATYIFGTNKKNEIDRFLCVYAHMLTNEERSDLGCLRHWYMPTVFSKIAIPWKNPPSKMMTQYQKPFMGKVETLRKDNVHWYLLMFDMHEGQMLWLDSKPDPNKMETKDYNISKMAMYIEEMLKDKSFYDYEETVRPKVFRFDDPKPIETGIQKADS
ncbi:hypothetical protein PIB30_067895, partial [Stylosanthes scabra]|nr:hypothetical protein [Stylosanthes scabra]